MRLKRLYIHGFKSFADRVEMTFEQGVTGVVGPNGCGKSNIADAVRWVLGEQSARQLRGAKMEDVIFGGTEKRRRLAFCEVTLVFDNEDHTLPVDYTEVSVTRRVYRTGESEYQLNGADCRLKDIVDLFRDTGIGRDGYSIIGQGRVDEILSQRSEDRRMIFEEAAGIVKYKARKNEAEKRLGNTEDNLSRVNDILMELESRIEPLRVQSEQAREYLSLREELKDLELNAFVLRFDRGQARIGELKAAVGELSQALTDNENAQAEAATRRADMQDMLTRHEEAVAALREGLQALIRDVEAQEGAAGVMRERIQADTREQARLSEELQAALSGGDGIERRIERLSDEINEEETRLKARQAALDARERALLEAEDETKACERESEDAKERVIQAINSLSDMRSEQARLSALKSAVEAQLGALAQGRDADEAEKAALQAEIDDAQALYDSEQARRNALEAQSADIAGKVKAANEEYEKLTLASQQILAQRQELSSRLKLLTEMQRDYEGYNHSVKQVLMEAKRQNLSAVRGVVASVIRVPQRIERAIDMVLGGALQNVVVDTDEDAKRMIEYLRRNRFGRATFLPIGSVRGRTLDARERQLLSMPGCVGLASEMVEFDPVYQGVVDSLLGRTVIAEDLDSGIAIQRAGRYQFRLVTVEGDVMHSGGSMTGGSVQSRMTSLLSREREITECGENLKTLTERLLKAQARMKERETQRADLKKERAELFDELHQQEIACARGEAHLNKANEDMEAYSQRAGKVVIARDQLREQLSEIEQGLTRLGSEKATREQSNEQLRAAAQETQTRLTRMRAAVDDARQIVADERVSLATARRGWEAAVRDRERLIFQKNDAEKLRAESEEKLTACRARLSENKTRLKSDETVLTELKQKLSDVRCEFERVDALRKDVQNELKLLSDRAETLRLQTEEMSQRHHRAELLLARVETELTQLTDRIWEDYELSYEGAMPFKREDFKLAEAEKRIAAIRARIREMGTVNVAALDEYRQTTQRFAELTAQKDDLDKAKADLNDIISELMKKMDTLFRARFEQLDAYFRMTFVELFGGGRAELRLEDPADALNSGIEIVAQPPGKKLQLLSLLSGGERALTAIAILFAMLKLKPTPFCFLDEIEAALDDANIDYFADYLKTYSQKTQFVVITHRKGTMTRCDALYGVAMEEKGVSKMMSVKLADAAW